MRTSGPCFPECLRQRRQSCPWSPPERVIGDAEVGALIGNRFPARRGSSYRRDGALKSTRPPSLGLRNHAIRSEVDRDVDQKWHVLSPIERRILASAPLYSGGFCLSGKPWPTWPRWEVRLRTPFRLGRTAPSFRDSRSRTVPLAPLAAVETKRPVPASARALRHHGEDRKAAKMTRWTAPHQNDKLAHGFSHQAWFLRLRAACLRPVRVGGTCDLARSRSSRPVSRYAGSRGAI